MELYHFFPQEPVLRPQPPGRTAPPNTSSAPVSPERAFGSLPPVTLSRCARLLAPEPGVHSAPPSPPARPVSAASRSVPRAAPVPSPPPPSRSSLVCPLGSRRSAWPSPSPALRAAVTATLRLKAERTLSAPPDPAAGMAPPPPPPPPCSEASAPPPSTAQLAALRPHPGPCPGPSLPGTPSPHMCPRPASCHTGRLLSDAFATTPSGWPLAPDTLGASPGLPVSTEGPLPLLFLFIYSSDAFI